MDDVKVRLRAAEKAFTECRSPHTAADYLDALFLAVEDDAITDDQFYDGARVIRDYLRRPFPRHE